MITKRLIPLTGRLLSPLRRGCKAVIVHNGAFTQTSLVVRILEAAPDHVLFETLDSFYRVSSAPVAYRAALPQSLAMCA